MPHKTRIASNAFQRILTAGALIPAVIVLMFYAPTWMLYGTLLLSFGIMGWEWSSMTKVPLGQLQMSILLITCASIFFLKGINPIVILMLCTGMFMLNLKKIVFSLGTLYLCSALLAILQVAHMPWVMMLLMVIVWSNDSFAYFTGKLIGGKKLCPALSPGKTWSGFIGGVFLGTLTAWLYTKWIVATGKSDIHVLREHPGYVCFVLSVIGHIGDLIESAAKRYFGVKDSGSIIPGHGGMLDRLDSLLAVAIAFQAFVFFLP